jgi:hypothetical protein
VSTREEIRRLARALESIAYNATDLSTCRNVARDAIDAEIAKTWAHPPIFYGDQPPGASPTPPTGRCARCGVVVPTHVDGGGVYTNAHEDSRGIDCFGVNTTPIGGASPTGDARPVQTGDTCPGCVSWVLDGEHNPTCPNLPAPPAETTTTNDKEK